MLWGPDVSDWQGEPNWAVAAAAGAAFGFCKATQGTGNVQDSLEHNRQGMAAAFYDLIGLYHFADLGDPLAEAEHLLDVVGPLREREVPVLDVEVGDTARWTGWANVFCGRVLDATGVRPIVYMSDDPAGRMGSVLGDYPLWDAAYGPNDGRVPGWSWPWGVGPWDRWTFWQFTSRGSCPGVGDLIDLSVTHLDRAGLRALSGAGPAPTPPEEDVMTPEESSAIISLGAEVHNLCAPLGVDGDDAYSGARRLGQLLDQLATERNIPRPQS